MRKRSKTHYLSSQNAQSAVTYLRMSTDVQDFSLANQQTRLDQYAQLHGLRILRSYEDAGRSGLTLAARPALKRLLTDVMAGLADFGHILVYDVSRWGRFQDSDEAAHYEFLCRSAGVSIHYCAEEFENDGGLAGTLMKSVKRVMAGEYSRELSAKVWAGHCRLFKLGYHQGAPAPLGFKRVMISATGEVKQDLSFGSHKSLSTDRVVLAPGSQKDRDLAVEIFRLFTSAGQSELAIADGLNAAGIVNPRGNPWRRNAICYLLKNEIYIGNAVYGRSAQKLNSRRLWQESHSWLRVEGVVPPLIDRSTFDAASRIFLARPRPKSNGEVEQALRALLAAHGTLSGSLMDLTPGCPSSSSVSKRYGGLLNAYDHLDYSPPRKYSWRPGDGSEIAQRYARRQQARAPDGRFVSLSAR